MNAGERLGGKYRLLRQIGEGAMGVVWEAVHETTQKRVAIKLLSKPSDDHRHRMMREARVCGQISHRNVIEIYDTGETDRGEPYLVMQLLSGETLADLLRRKRRLEQPLAARIGRDIARALAAAHAVNVIHRDLKPANVFLHQEAGTDGLVVKVLDFGVAKDLAGNDVLVTAVGGAVGSPAYMSPEAISAARDLDARTDVWSLGVVLFEMLAGTRPFPGGGQELLLRILSRPIPRVSDTVRHVDPDLDALVTQCLDRARQQRMASAAAVARALELYVGPNETSRVHVGLAERALAGATPDLVSTPASVLAGIHGINTPAMQAWLSSPAVDVTAPLPPPSAPKPKTGKTGTMIIGEDIPKSTPQIPQGPRGTALMIDAKAVRALAAMPLPSPPPPPPPTPKLQSTTPTVLSQKSNVKGPASAPAIAVRKNANHAHVVVLVVSGVLIAGLTFAIVMRLARPSAEGPPKGTIPSARALQNP